MGSIPEVLALRPSGCPQTFRLPSDLQVAGQARLLPPLELRENRAIRIGTSCAVRASVRGGQRRRRGGAQTACPANHFGVGAFYNCTRNMGWAKRGNASGCTRVVWCLGEPVSKPGMPPTFGDSSCARWQHIRVSAPSYTAQSEGRRVWHT